MIKLVLEVKPLTVHTEMAWITYPMLLDLIRKVSTILFVITPVNYEYAVSVLGFRGSLEEFSDKLTEIYGTLAKYAEMQLHIHLSLFPELLSRDVKENMIVSALEWGSERGFRFSKVVFGWWKYDKAVEDICNSLGLKIVKRGEYPHIHDYDLLYLKENQVLRRALKTRSIPFILFRFLTEQAAWILFFIKNKQLKDYIAKCAYME